MTSQKEAETSQDAADSEASTLQECIRFKEQLQTERHSQFRDISQQMKDLSLKEECVEKFREKSQATESSESENQPVLAIPKGLHKIIFTSCPRPSVLIAFIPNCQIDPY